MNGLSTVTSKGQITIPYDIRSLMKIQEGDRVLFKKTDPVIRQVVIKVISRNIVDELAGSLSTKVKETNLGVAREKAGLALAKKYGLLKKGKKKWK